MLVGLGINKMLWKCEKPCCNHALQMELLRTRPLEIPTHLARACGNVPEVLVLQALQALAVYSYGHF